MTDRLEILAKLSVSGSEREKTQRELERMLDFVGCLREVDTDGVEPMIQPVENPGGVYREDCLNAAAGAAVGSLPEGVPEIRDGMVVVPRSI